jgi:hypothetical protein
VTNKSLSIEHSISRSRVEVAEDWRGRISEIPYIKWPADWEVRAIPPFGGALVRYMVRLPNGAVKSIYLDCFQSLGFFGQEAYWEVYPVGGDVGRCAVEDVQELLRLVADEAEVEP